MHHKQKAAAIRPLAGTGEHLLLAKLYVPRTRGNLFVVPLDEAGYWYRYHHPSERARWRHGWPVC